MMSTPLSNWRNASTRTQYISWFYEALLQCVLKARPSSEGDVDLVLRRLEAAIEVKAGGSDHRVRIPDDQYVQHVELASGFPNPYQRLIYCICCYNSRETSREARKGRRRSLLRNCKSELDVYEVLAAQTDTVYVMDHRVIAAVRDRNGVALGKLPCERERGVIELTRAMLRGFREISAATALSFYGLDPQEWVIRERQMVIAVPMPEVLVPYRLELNVVEVVEKEFLPDLDAVTRPRTDRFPTRRTMALRRAPTPALATVPA